MSEFTLSPALAAKVGSILVHIEEGLSLRGHAFDWTALQELMKDADVQAWLVSLGPLVPRKRVAEDLRLAARKSRKL